MHNALAESVLTHYYRRAHILRRAGQKLARAGRIAVDQHRHRLAPAAFVRIEFLPVAVSVLDVRIKSLRQQRFDYAGNDVEIAARIIAHVHDQRLSAVFVKVVNRTLNAVGRVALKFVYHHIADLGHAVAAVQQTVFHAIDVYHLAYEFNVDILVAAQYRERYACALCAAHVVNQLAGIRGPGAFLRIRLFVWRGSRKRVCLRAAEHSRKRIAVHSHDSVARLNARAIRRRIGKAARDEQRIL